MSRETVAQTQPQQTTFSPLRGGILQRKCACGQHTVAGGECAECRQKRLQRQATGHTEPETVPPIVDEVLRSPGQPLDEGTRTFMEERFGQDFSGVRVHTDGKATESAQAVNALAYTVGQDVVFGSGQYAPSTSVGKKLLAHELTHTIQQKDTSSPILDNPLSKTSLTISQRNNPLEQEAEQVANQVMVEHPTQTGFISPKINTPQPLIARQETAITVPRIMSEDINTVNEDKAVELSPPNEMVSLTGSNTFTPPPTWDAYLESKGSAGAMVPIKFGNLAQGQIRVTKSGDFFETIGHQPIPLSHPTLQPLRDVGVEPVIALRIRESNLDGYATIADTVGNRSALVNWIKEHTTEMGWLGLDVTNISNFTNKVQGGALHLQLSNFNFVLGGYLQGTGNFGFVNENVTFNAQATVKVPNLTETQLNIEQDEQGSLYGEVEIPVNIANFSGNLRADYGNGTVNIKGTVGYNADKFNGEVTLLVTDQKTARNIARERLSSEQIMASAQQVAGQDESKRGTRPGPRALAGFGTLNFAFTEWMTGQAEVIIDNEGHITVIGEIAPPAEVELFPQRDFMRKLFTMEVRTLYGIPLVGNVFLSADISLEALAKLGPAKIYNIAVRGTYSTAPDVLQNFELEATLNISAFAGVRLRTEGGAGVELLGHDIKSGIGIDGLAGVRGYVEATPTIGYRETADPQAGKRGEYFIKGYMELVAQPFLGLSGDLFVELDSPLWSPAPDKKWTWPVGQLEYPLPGELGIGADVDYVIGSEKWPEIQFSEVNFSKDKFMTDLLNDHIPPKSKGEQKKQGEWQEDKTSGKKTKPPQTSSTSKPTSKSARGRQKPGDGEVPTPNVQRRWLQGMQALGSLAKQSRHNPLTHSQIKKALAGIKRQYGFRKLYMKRIGNDWQVIAWMNPNNKNKPLIIKGEPDNEQSTEEKSNAPKGLVKETDVEQPTDAPSGKTRSDPIEMIWYKPPGLYPPFIQLGSESYFFKDPDWLVVPPVKGLSDVRRSGSTSGMIKIGIEPTGDFYPTRNKVWPRVEAKKLRTGVKQKNFRILLEEYGYYWGTKQADHVRDIQWGGEDDYANLWPLEEVHNNAANQILSQLVRYKNDSGIAETVELKKTPLNRWFIIKVMKKS